MLYVPLAVGLAVSPPRSGLAPVLLVLAAGAAFIAQNCGRLAVRKRRRRAEYGRWFALFAGLTVAAGAPLLVLDGSLELVGVAAVGGLLLGVVALLRRWPPHRRLDRTVLGEGLATAGLTLTGPAAVWVGREESWALAGWVWLASLLCYLGGVIRVKALLNAARRRRRAAVGDGSVGRERAIVLGYQGILLAGLAVSWATWGDPGLLALIAYIPGALASWQYTRMLGRELPPLKVVGFVELGLSLWFGAFIVAALAAAGV
jgi:hypothetical protein